MPKSAPLPRCSRRANPGRLAPGHTAALRVLRVGTSLASQRSTWNIAAFAGWHGACYPTRRPLADDVTDLARRLLPDAPPARRRRDRLGTALAIRRAPPSSARRRDRLRVPRPARRKPRAGKKPPARRLLLAVRSACGATDARPSADASGAHASAPRSLALAGETKSIIPAVFCKVSSVDNSQKLVDKLSASVENWPDFGLQRGGTLKVIPKTGRVIHRLLTSYPQKTLVIFLDLVR